jgi:homoserine/homoserine lactone efflux protein
MTFETWLTFAVAYTIISVIPGPSVAVVLAQSLSRGLGAGLFCVLGDLIGGIVVMSLAYTGLGVILQVSIELFQLIKWLGVAYMAYLGLTQIVQAKQLAESDMLLKTLPQSSWVSLHTGFVAGVLNPKAIIFYLAFFAQFINTNQATLPQFFILAITSTIIVAVVLSIYAVLASRLRKSMQSLDARKRMGYVGGSFLLGGSAFLSTSK